MSIESDKKSDEFLRICKQFQLGGLITESSHPITKNLSDTALKDIAQGLKLLFEVDEDVVRAYRAFVESGRASRIASDWLTTMKNGGRVFFTGCGSTGRLSIQLVSVWRDFWQRHTGSTSAGTPSSAELEQRALAVMAGGDYALIKSVEGFEDFTAFGRKQIGDLGVSSSDLVFAITEGGETSFVIGTAWQGVDARAKVYFVYNNPDAILCPTVERSRQIIQDPRVETVNLTTGPMAITGSTRMQATSIQLCVLLTIMEMVVRELLGECEPPDGQLARRDVPATFLDGLQELYRTLNSAPVLEGLASLVALEEAAYRAGHKNNYFADRFAIDVLTDTTERSPTYCTPPFRKFDDLTATESWAFLFSPPEDTTRSWERIIKRRPACIGWTEEEIRALVPPEKFSSTSETVRRIGYSELMRFKVGLDGLVHRRLGHGDISMAVVSGRELSSLREPGGFYRAQLEAAHDAGARIGLLFFGNQAETEEAGRILAEWKVSCQALLVPLPQTGFLLDGLARVGVKLVLNALSTCTMVRLGRVMGNYMIWVVPSNLKLIDRATRYVCSLTDLNYRDANRLVFEVMEYVAPRMKADREYPPVVGVSVLRARYQLSNEQAEAKLRQEGS